MVKLSLMQSGALVAFAALLFYVVLFHTDQGRGALVWFNANAPAVFMLSFALLAAYFWFKAEKKDEWAECWEVLEASLEVGGLRVYGLVKNQILSGPKMGVMPIMPSRIEPHMAYLYIGDFFMQGARQSFMLNGKKPARGDMLQAWDYALTEKQIKELQKSGVSLEDAYSKIAEIKKADNAAQEATE